MIPITENTNPLITVIDSIMGSGKTTWFQDELLAKQTDKNILYITPILSEIEDLRADLADKGIRRPIYEPTNMGDGKLGNIVDLINNQTDIASTHELFRRFDDRCYEALTNNKYTLVIDEALTAVDQYQFIGKQDYIYLLDKKDISVDDTGLIHWTGEDLETRFSDVRILAKNDCLYKIDEKFFLWHFPHRFFPLFEKVYVLTYNFTGTLLKYYFDLYSFRYDVKSLNDDHQLCDYISSPDKSAYRERFNIYEKGSLLANISQKSNTLSASWYGRSYNKPEIETLKANLYNYSRNIIDAKSEDIMWTTFKDYKSKLCGKGYTKGFVSCNAKSTDDYHDRTTLMYCVNSYIHPEIDKFFRERNIPVDRDQIALSEMLQWIWRSNIRDRNSDKQINIYIPSSRMRTLFTNWLAS